MNNHLNSTTGGTIRVTDSGDLVYPKDTSAAPGTLLNQDLVWVGQDKYLELSNLETFIQNITEIHNSGDSLEKSKNLSGSFYFTIAVSLESDKKRTFSDTVNYKYEKVLLIDFINNYISFRIANIQKFHFNKEIDLADILETTDSGKKMLEELKKYSFGILEPKAVPLTEIEIQVQE